jgi:myo-inositol-1(or 4)-monophosphatase
MPFELQILCQSVCQLTKEVGKFIINERKLFSVSDIQVKGKNDFVSYVDKKSEETLVKGLNKLLPEAGFIAEENTSTIKGEHYNWIIDPLDGTTNFIHGIPCFAISIALMHDNEIVLGVVYEINLDECFYAWKGSKAYLNEKEIRVSSVAKLSDSLLATGFPYYDYHLLDEYLELFRYFMQHTHGLRRWGSAATDLAYVACGRFDGFYEYGLQPWDVAAGTLIVQQAGGRVTDFSGKGNFIFGKELISGNSLFFDEFSEVIKKHFNKNGRK